MTQCWESFKAFWVNLWAARHMAVPFYVTRKDAEGRIGYWTVNAWAGLLILLLLVANAILFGIVGVVTAIGLLL